MYFPRCGTALHIAPFLMSDENDIDVENRPITAAQGKYIVGKRGSTINRLKQFSGAELDVHKDNITIKGSGFQRDRAVLAIKITLQQMEGGGIEMDSEEMDNRSDTSIIDVPSRSVGLILGNRGTTLRTLESKNGTFMFFNQVSPGDLEWKRLYVLGDELGRDNAVNAVKNMIHHASYSIDKSDKSDKSDSQCQTIRRRYDDRRYDDRRYDDRRYDDRRYDDRRYDDRRYDDRRYDDRRYDDRRYDNYMRYMSERRYDNVRRN